MSTTATVTGPVSGGGRGRPFGGAMTDVATHGYREDELFLEGTATRFCFVPPRLVD